VGTPCDRRARRAPAVLRDAAVAAVVGAIQFGVASAAGASAVVIALVLCEPLPLLLRRTRPTVTIGVVGLVDVLLVRFAGAPIAAVGASIVVAAYSAGAYQARRPAVVSLLIGIGAEVALAAIGSSGLGVLDVVGASLVTATAWWLGATIRERRERTAELEARTQALHAARLELAERAVAEERLRLARELHDVVAHSLAIIALHSSVGAHNAEQRPRDAVDALAAINTATRSALAELRALLVVLREPTASDGDLVTPLPSLEDLDALCAHATTAGMTVQATVDGDVSGLPRAVSLTGYRVIQEAITNAVKHAASSDVDVRVAVTPGRLAVAVSNGPPRATPTTKPVGPGGPGGAGLAGMRDRVAAFGGDLTTTATPDGGWVVRATLAFEEAGT
jgi:signal transduction histidine kinase